MTARYTRRYAPEHPNAGVTGLVSGHVFVAAQAMGRALPPGAEVHHLNGDGMDNRPENLVVCEDRAYHRLLHQRQRALETCGNAGWIACGYCGVYDDPGNLCLRSDTNAPSGHHRACHTDYVRERRAKARPAPHSKLYCKRGHPLFGPNLKLYRGARYCRACRKLWGRKRTERERAIRAEQEAEAGHAPVHETSEAVERNGPGAWPVTVNPNRKARA